MMEVNMALKRGIVELEEFNNKWFEEYNQSISK